MGLEKFQGFLIAASGGRFTAIDQGFVHIPGTAGIGEEILPDAHAAECGQGGDHRRMLFAVGSEDFPGYGADGTVIHDHTGIFPGIPVVEDEGTGEAAGLQIFQILLGRIAHKDTVAGKKQLILHGRPERTGSVGLEQNLEGKTFPLNGSLDAPEKAQHGLGPGVCHPEDEDSVGKRASPFFQAYGLEIGKISQALRDLQYPLFRQGRYFPFFGFIVQYQGDSGGRYFCLPGNFFDCNHNNAPVQVVKVRLPGCGDVFPAVHSGCRPAESQWEQDFPGESAGDGHRGSARPFGKRPGDGRDERLSSC